MYDNTIITSSNILDPNSKSIKQKFYDNKNINSQSSSLSNTNNINNPFNQNMSELAKNPLLHNTKTSVKNLIKYNDEFQNKNETRETIDEVEVKKILIPFYDNIEQIQNEIKNIQNINNNKDILNNKKNIDKLITISDNLNKNKNNIEETLIYMKENIDNVHYEDINKEFILIKENLENLFNEIENIENEFNNKFEIIINEKKREKIYNDLMNSDNNNNINTKKYFPNEDVRINNLDYIDYNDIKNDINDINLEKDGLWLKYLTDKEKFEKNLPQLIKPSEKIDFRYDLNENEKNKIKNKKNINEIDNNINNDDYYYNDFDNNKISNDKSKRALNNKKNFENSKNYSPNENKRYINNTNNSNKSKISNEKFKRESQYNPSIDNTKSFHSNQPSSKKSKLTPNEQMLLYQSHMNELSKNITSSKSRLANPKKKIMYIGPSKENYKITKQPRSLNSKRTLQDFKRIPNKPIYEYVKVKDDDNKGKFREGIYPTTKEKNLYKTFVEHNYYYNGMNEDQINEFIRKYIYDYIIDMINNPDKYKKKQMEEINKGYNNEDLINLLIKKFSDLEQAILRGLNNNNYMPYNNDLNDQIADAIYNQIKSDLGIKININDNMNNSQNLNNTSQTNRSQRIKLKLDNRVKEDDNNIFNNDQKLSIDDLDKLIQMPHKINLSEYDISKSSSYMSNDLNKKEIFDNLNINISINKKINKKTTFDESDNSLSRGQILDDSLNIKANDKILEKNRTGLDLLMVKNFNENIPEQIMYNNISNIEENNNNESFSNSFINDNNEIIDINNNNRLKMLQLYESKEYQIFKNNFINEINKNYNNNIYNSLKLNKDNNINNIINKSKQIENSMKYLKNNINRTINEKEESSYTESNNNNNKNNSKEKGYLSPGEIPSSEDNDDSNN